MTNIAGIAGMPDWAHYWEGWDPFPPGSVSRAVKGPTGSRAYIVIRTYAESRFSVQTFGFDVPLYSSGFTSAYDARGFADDIAEEKGGWV